MTAKRKQTTSKPAKPKVPLLPGAGRGGNIPPTEHRWPKGVSGNPHGRPQTITALKAYIQALGAEPVNGTMSRLDLLLRSMFQSKNSGDRLNLLRYGWGNVPQPIGGSDDLGPIQIEAVNAYSYDAAVAAIAARPDTDSTEPS